MASPSRAQRLLAIEKNLAFLQKITSDPNTTDEQLQIIDNRLAYMKQDLHLNEKQREILDELLDDEEEEREKREKKRRKKRAKERRIHTVELSAVKAEDDAMEGVIQSRVSTESERGWEKIEDLEMKDVNLQHVKKTKLRFKKKKVAIKTEILD
ncbi:hypothetical protein DL95DRAFT_415498 [Leptodontidium sp. 2 PMI_412]|nr:hypothetical protein DL95DRAFT_415498 [Leptodontidium sp. 2 PMI_412]